MCPTVATSLQLALARVAHDFGIHAHLILDVNHDTVAGVALPSEP